MDMVANTPVEFNCLETLAKTFDIPSKQNQFNTGNIFSNAPVRRIAVAVNTNSAFTGSEKEKNPFWYQNFNLRQIRTLTGAQPIVNFDATDVCLFDHIMKAMNFLDDIPSIPMDIFKDHSVPMFDSTSIQDATENRH